MNCPKCGKELRQGWIDAPKAPFWSPEEKNHAPNLTEDIQLYGIEPADFLRQRRFPTGICEDCRILVSEY